MIVNILEQESKESLELKFLVLQDLIKIGLLSLNDNILNCIQTLSNEYNKRLEVENLIKLRKESLL